MNDDQQDKGWHPGMEIGVEPTEIIVPGIDVGTRVVPGIYNGTICLWQDCGTYWAAIPNTVICKGKS